MSATNDRAGDLPVDLLCQLLAATEALAAALEESEDPVVWTREATARDAVYARLVAVLDDGSTRRILLATPAARALLDRLRALDAALLEKGQGALAQLARERHLVTGRRRGVRAHGDRGREAPRAVTIKA